MPDTSDLSLVRYVLIERRVPRECIRTRLAHNCGYGLAAFPFDYEASERTRFEVFSPLVFGLAAEEPNLVCGGTRLDEDHGLNDIGLPVVLNLDLMERSIWVFEV